MKSKKNLTRFTYEKHAFQGWRLCLSRAGTTFTKYLSDAQYGGSAESLDAAEKCLQELKDLIGNSRRVNGKLSKKTIAAAKKITDREPTVDDLKKTVIDEKSTPEQVSPAKVSFDTWWKDITANSTQEGDEPNQEAVKDNDSEPTFTERKSSGDFELAAIHSFEKWWDNVGSGLMPEGTEGLAEFTERVSRLAWGNGSKSAEEPPLL